jgi:spermidine synthase
MGKITNILSGVKILEVANSPINGRLVVVKDLTFGTHIQANGTTQSGGIAEYVWKFTLKKLHKEKHVFTNILILGLGGGSIAKISKKFWPEAAIVGVDIDPIIVRLGEEYMNVKKYNVETHITDAEEFVKKEKRQFDLICVDMYQGNKFPEKFAEEKFIKQVKSLLSENGIAVFNRLYGGNHRKSANQMLKTLEKVFPTVDPVFPEANVMFVCKN